MFAWKVASRFVCDRIFDGSIVKRFSVLSSKFWLCHTSFIKYYCVVLANICNKICFLANISINFEVDMASINEVSGFTRHYPSIFNMWVPPSYWSCDWLIRASSGDVYRMYFQRFMVVQSCLSNFYVWLKKKSNVISYYVLICIFNTMLSLFSSSRHFLLLIWKWFYKWKIIDRPKTSTERST